MQSIRYRIPLMIGIKSDSSVVDLEGVSLDSYPLALKSALAVQPEVSQPRILEGESSYAKVSPAKRKSPQKQSKDKKNIKSDQFILIIADHSSLSSDK
jgi:hypothetical protein